MPVLQLAFGHIPAIWEYSTLHRHNNALDT